MRVPFYYGWVIVAAAFVTMAVGVNARTAFSLLFPPILSEFGWERGVTAGAFSFGFLVSGLFGPFLGRSMDRHGPRVVMFLGTVALALGLAVAPLATRPWHLYVTLGSLVGGGTVCLGYTGQSLFLPNWFVERRGLAMGIAFSGVGLGSIVLLPSVQAIIARFGWRSACLALAALVLVVLTPLCLLLHRRPEDLGLLPDGERVAQGGTRRTTNVVDAAWTAIEWTLGRAVRTGRFWWIALGYLTGLYAWYAVQVHQTKYLVEIGFTPSEAAWALGLVSLAGIPGQVLLGHLSDRIGREWVWTLACAGFIVALGLLLAMRTNPTAALLTLVIVTLGGLGYGVAAVFGAIPVEIFQGRHYGTIFGTLSLASLVGGAIGPWLTGTLYDRTGSYAIAFWIAIAASALSATAIWLASPRSIRAVAGRTRRPA